MRRIKRLSQISVAVVLLAGSLAINVPNSGRAEAASGPSLVISQLKITSSDGQFVTLYNTTDSELDMSHYQLEYFNNYDLGKATSSRLIALSGTVPPHSYYMVNDDDLLLCYRLTVDSKSLGFSSTAGFIEILSSEQGGEPGVATSPTLEDYVGWSKKDAAGAQTLPGDTSAFLQRQPIDAGNDPTVSLPGAGTWQAVRPASNNPCNLVSLTADTVSVPSGMEELLSAGEPPVTILSTGSDSSQPAPAIPAADIGLMSPVVNELLPNPSGTGNDKTDEFIELYNPNTRAFEMSGFSLQVGTTTTHTYTFPAGTSLPPHGFEAFYSSDTKLSLSNTSGQVRLLDPFGNSISVSGTYSSAKDGIAWALAKGKWYWTIQPTPGKANVVKQPPAKKSLKSSRKKAPKVKSAAGIKRIKSMGSGGLPDDSSGRGSTPIHAWTLAIIAGLALLYGAYEYRADIANYFRRLRSHHGFGRKNG